MTADERIAKLIERSGSSQIVVPNTVESHDQRHDGFAASVHTIIARDFGGDVYA